MTALTALCARASSSVLHCSQRHQPTHELLDLKRGTRKRTAFVIVGFGALFLSLSCGGDSATQPPSIPSVPIPSTLNSVSGAAQADTIGAALGQHLVVRVESENGTPVQGVPIDFEVTAGEAGLSASSVRTDDRGRSAVNVTFGTQAGEVHVRASSAELPAESSVNFQLTALPGELAQLQTESEGPHRGIAGQPLSEPLQVIVVDRGGNRLSRIEISAEWQVLEGDGSIERLSSTTDDEGRAAAAWTLGPGPGRQLVTVNVGSAETRFVAYAMAAVRQVAHASLPSCGDVITADVTLSGDLTCPVGFTGTVLTIGADGITFDGAGRTVTAPGASTIFLATSKTGITIKDVIVAPGTGSGTGVLLIDVTNSTLSGISATNRSVGIQSSGTATTGNVLQGNTLSGNVTGINFQGDGNTFSGNDLSNSSSFGLVINGSGFTITNDNDFTGAANGLGLVGPANMTIENLVFPASIPGTTLKLLNSTVLTVQNITAPGTGSGIGVHLINVTNSTVSGIGATNRATGMLIQNSTDLTVEDITAPGTGSGTGVLLIDVTNSTLSGISATNRSVGIQSSGTATTGNVLQGNTLSGNVTGINFQGDGNTFSGNDLSNNSSFGLVISGSNIVVGPGNVITNNGTGVLSSGSSNVNINNNVIAGNVTFGVQNANNAVVINAENNFWGDPSGPLDNDVRVGGLNDALGLSNPAGLGDAVTDFVDYVPFLTPPQQIEALIGKLQGIVAGNPGTPLADKLEDAIAKLETALQELNKTLAFRTPGTTTASSIRPRSSTPRKRKVAGGRGSGHIDGSTRHGGPPPSLPTTCR